MDRSNEASPDVVISMVVELRTSVQPGPPICSSRSWMHCEPVRRFELPPNWAVISRNSPAIGSTWAVMDVQGKVMASLSTGRHESPRCVSTVRENAPTSPTWMSMELWIVGQCTPKLGIIGMIDRMLMRPCTSLAKGRVGKANGMRPSILPGAG